MTSPPPAQAASQTGATTADAAAAARRADAEARRLAQTRFEGALVLEAGAGTGKTATLVARVLAWALGPGWARARSRVAAGGPASDRIAESVLSRIAAITFTEAAAAEMAERIGHGMLQVAAGRLPVGLLRDALPDDDDVLRERAAALLVAIDQLEVRTIHGWCTQLLQRHALAAGLHPRFAVDADGRVREELVARELRATLQRAFAEPVDAQVMALAAAGQGPRALAGALAACAEGGLTAAALAADATDPAITGAIVAQAGAALRTLAVELAPLAAARRKLRTQELQEAAVHLAARLDGADGWAVLCAAAPDLLDRFDGALSGLARGKVGKTEQELLGDLSPDLRTAADDLRRIAAFLVELDPDALRRIQSVLAPVLARVESRLARQGVLAFADLLEGAATLLEARPAVRAQVRAELDQLLVDEFQDTDPRQCALVRCLALDGPMDQRPGLFIVGDPKQSIYGWRSADLAAYDGFVAELVAQGGQQAGLTVSFRSVPAVLDAVTGAVSPVMHPAPGHQPAFQPLFPAPHLADAAGFVNGAQRPVELWATWGWSGPDAPDPELPRADARRVEAAAVAADLVDLHRAGVPWSDAAVLFRSGTELPTLVAALRDAGVPYAVERDRSYFQRREIADASALVGVVADPHDHVALVAWLRSTAVGVPDAALLPLWRGGLPAALGELEDPQPDALARLDTLVAQAARETRALHDAIPGLAALSAWPHSLCDAVRRLARLRQALRTWPVDRFVAAVRSESGLELIEGSRYLGAWRLANLDRFFRELREGLETGEDLTAVLRRLREGLAGRRDAEEGRPQEAAADAVQLMTIHKSKGLGFAHVYLVGLDRESRSGRLAPDQVEGPRAWRLLGQDSPGMLLARRRAARVERAEAVRLLYVAMTRAKQRLVLVGRWPGAPEPVEPDRARSATALMGAWAAVPEDLQQRAAALPAEVDVLDLHGVRWRFPGRVPAAAAQSSGRQGDAARAALAPRIAADQRTLRAHRADAAARMARPWLQAPSGTADEPLDLEAAGLLPPAPPPVAALAGTLVHGLLERVDLGRLAADGAAAFVPLLDALPARARALAADEPAHAAVERARDVLARFLAGPLLAELVRLAPHVRARELDLLLPPSDAGPVGAVSGTLDLLLLDPDDGALVVVDHKTDDLPPDPAAVAARAAHHAPQLLAYRDAVAAALGPDVRVRAELWFLVPGLRVPVD
ncbi:MAG: UvrD-helicase domain-containing protein [Alphaproteobacteria bacterium]|nr:UvrD-helicase domain-containing protein [Alphaproteobacteria bacterium]